MHKLAICIAKIGCACYKYIYPIGYIGCLRFVGIWRRKIPFFDCEGKRRKKFVDSIFPLKNRVFIWKNGRLAVAH